MKNQLRLIPGGKEPAEPAVAMFPPAILFKTNAAQRELLREMYTEEELQELEGRRAWQLSTRIKQILFAELARRKAEREESAR